MRPETPSEIKGRPLFKSTRYTDQDYYDSGSTITGTATIDFNKFGQNPRLKPSTPQDFHSLDFQPVGTKPGSFGRTKCPKGSTLLASRHGREDNLMYRQTGQGKNAHKNKVNLTKIRLSMESGTEYDFRRDFLGQRK